MMKTYELWRAGDGALVFIPQDHKQKAKMLDALSQLVWTCQADSWESAMEQRDAYLNIEAYGPISMQSDDETG